MPRGPADWAPDALALALDVAILAFRIKGAGVAPSSRTDPQDLPLHDQPPSSVVVDVVELPRGERATDAGS